MPQRGVAEDLVLPLTQPGAKLGDLRDPLSEVVRAQVLPQRIEDALVPRCTVAAANTPAPKTFAKVSALMRASSGGWWCDQSQAASGQSTSVTVTGSGMGGASCGRVLDQVSGVA